MKMVRSLAEEAVRVKTHGVNPPLRTTAEMAEEFGVTLKQLAGFLGKDPNAPAPELSKRGKNSWYDPRKMRRWWASRTPKP